MQLPNASEVLSVDNPYHKAKVEHYLERVEELVRMSRYRVALKTLVPVFALDPHNEAGHALQMQINATLQELSTATFKPENGHVRQFRRGELVLVVDQDERILTSLTDTLRSYGFGALGAGTFDEAIETLSIFKPNLIISEVNFESGPIGYDLYLWVRHNQELNSTPFLYLATRVTREMLIAGRRMGVDDFIVKPLDDEVVMASVLHCLSHKRKKVA